MATKRSTKKSPAKAGGNASPIEGSVSEIKRLQSAPRFVGPGWSLREGDRTRFLATTGVDDVMNRLGEGVHAGDREILENALAAQLGFHAFSDFVDRIDYWVDHEEDLESELKSARIAFELSMQALDSALGDRYSDLLKQHRRSLQQSTRASKTRTPLLTDVVRRISLRPGTAKELWPELFWAMENAGLAPIDEATSEGNPAIAYTDVHGRAKRISLATFQNRLTAMRNESQ